MGTTASARNEISTTHPDWIVIPLQLFTNNAVRLIKKGKGGAFRIFGNGLGFWFGKIWFAFHKEHRPLVGGGCIVIYFAVFFLDFLCSFLDRISPLLLFCFGLGLQSHTHHFFGPHFTLSYIFVIVFFFMLGSIPHPFFFNFYHHFAILSIFYYTTPLFRSL